MVDPVTIGIENNKWLFDASTELITISSNELRSTVSYISLHDSADADFLVPVGKKFIILQINLNDTNGGGAEQYIKYHTVADTDGGTRFIYEKSVDGYINGSQNVFITIPAGNYINHKGTTELVMTGILTTV